MAKCDAVSVAECDTEWVCIAICNRKRARTDECIAMCALQYVIGRGCALMSGCALQNVIGRGRALMSALQYVHYNMCIAICNRKRARTDECQPYFECFEPHPSSCT